MGSVAAVAARAQTAAKLRSLAAGARKRVSVGKTAVQGVGSSGPSPVSSPVASQASQSPVVSSSPPAAAASFDTASVQAAASSAATTAATAAVADLQKQFARLESQMESKFEAVLAAKSAG